MRYILGLLLSTLFSFGALAQGTGQLQPGQVWGNPSAAQRSATAATISAMLDRSPGCSPQGDIIFRGASAWSCLAPGTAGLPLLSGGAGADLAYGTLGAAAGGTGRNTLTNHSVLIGAATAAVTQTAVGGTNFPLIGQAGADPVWSTVGWTANGAVSGGILCFTTTTSSATSNLQTLNAIVLGGGAGACPGPLGSLGTTTTVLHGNAAGAPSFAAVAYADIATADIATLAQYIAGTSNKLVQAGTIFTTETTTTFGVTTTFDFANFINTAVTLTANMTGQVLSNIKAGQAGTIAFIQDGTGSRTITWSSIWKFASGSQPVLTTTPNAVDILSYSCRSATFCVASLIKDVR